MARRRTLIPALVVGLLAAALALGVRAVDAGGPRADPALRAELVAMAAESRTSPDAAGARAERLAEILDEHGWPTYSLVGEDGGEAAWLIAQQADGDVGLQRRALRLLAEAADRDEASPANVAHLTDRIAANTRTPQVYGTQVGCVDGRPVPGPIAEEASVDERRRAVGLGPLDQYLEQMAPLCTSPTPSPT